MRAELVGERAVTLRFAGSVPAYGELVPIVRQVLIERGFAPWPDTEVDCFCSDGEALVFARPGRPRERAFRFPDLEALLCAVRAIPGGGGALYDAGEGYILTVPPEQAYAALWEFGAQTRLDPALEAHLREQGRCILSADAAERLRRAFGGM